MAQETGKCPAYLGQPADNKGGGGEIGDEGKGPSKNELKKRAKEEEKARKAAERRAKEEEAARAKAAEEEAFACIATNHPLLVRGGCWTRNTIPRANCTREAGSRAGEMGPQVLRHRERDRIGIPGG